MSFKKILICSTVIASLSVAANARVDIVADVGVAPPPPQAEVVPVVQPGYVWAPGYWSYQGPQPVWVPGRMIPAQPGYHWVPEHWVQRGPRYHFVPGRWVADLPPPPPPVVVAPAVAPAIGGSIVIEGGGHRHY